MGTSLDVQPLGKGETFWSLNGQRQGLVGDLLGQGGQGAVHRVEFSSDTYALKWYHDHYIDVDGTLKDRLRRTIARGAPDKRFLWPLELVQMPGRRAFGYVMALRPGEYRCIRDLLAPPPNRIVLSLEKRLRICRQIADSFLNLHAGGFCYQDINFGNFFIHPNTADVLICDNDNVNVDGADASIYGTRKFMAPEVVRREILPNTRTDLFSMAVLFFYVLFGWHPLDGKREANARVLNAEVEMDLYGNNPKFIFDPSDDENGPVSPMHDAVVCRWNSLPQSLRDLFIRSFCEGLSSPDRRVLEQQWLKAFELIRSAVFECPACRYEHVLEPSSNQTDSMDCVYCGQAFEQPPFLQIGRAGFVLTRDKAIGLRDIGVPSAAAWDSAALVVEHPTRKGVLGLRNMMEKAWVVRSDRTASSSVAPGKTVMLLDALRVDFGSHSGTIRDPANADRVSLKPGADQPEGRPDD